MINVTSGVVVLQETEELYEHQSHPCRTTVFFTASDEEDVVTCTVVSVRTVCMELVVSLLVYVAPVVNCMKYRRYMKYIIPA